MSKQNYLNSNQLHSSPLLAVEQLGKQLGKTLILAPHPDDEALGCAGLILYLRSQNIPVWVIFMTSGEASHPNSNDYPHKVLAALREKEAIQACEILGVLPSNVFFLRQPDSFLIHMKLDMKKSIATEISELIRQFDVDSVFLPWRRDSHPDHIVTYEIGAKAIAEVSEEIRIIEYPIWLWKSSQIVDWPIKDEVEIFRLNIGEMLALKEEAIFAHKSQTSKLIKDDPEGFILTADLLSPFLTPFEVYFFEADKKTTSLERDYFDALYNQNPDPWNFRNSDYEKEKYIKIESFLKNRRYERGLELGCSIGVQTQYFAKHCEHLLAVDISKDAIASAKKFNKALLNVDFQEIDILKEFPENDYDFISMCEIGYYFASSALETLFKKITNQVMKNGHFLMVHWTSYVREYPLTGRQVHELFKNFNRTNLQFKCISSYVHESYELMLWQKI